MGKIKYNEELMTEFINKLTFISCAMPVINNDLNTLINRIPNEIKNNSVESSCDNLKKEITDYISCQDLFYNRVVWSHNLVKSNDEYLESLFDRLNENIESVFHSDDFDVSTACDKLDNFFSKLSCDERVKLFDYAYKFFDGLHKGLKHQIDYLYVDFEFSSEDEWDEFYELFLLDTNGATINLLGSCDGYSLTDLVISSDSNGKITLKMPIGVYNQIVTGDIYTELGGDRITNRNTAKINAINSAFYEKKFTAELLNIVQLASVSTYSLTKNCLMAKKICSFDKYKYVFDKDGNQQKDANGNWLIDEKYLKMLSEIYENGAENLLKNFPKDIGPVDFDYNIDMMVFNELSINEQALLLLLGKNISDDVKVDGEHTNLYYDSLDDVADYFFGLKYKYSEQVAYKLALKYLDDVPLVGSDFASQLGEIAKNFLIGFGDGFKGVFKGIAGWFSTEEAYYLDDPTDIASKKFWSLLTSLEYDPKNNINPKTYSLQLNEERYRQNKITELEYRVMKKIYDTHDNIPFDILRDLYVFSYNAGKFSGSVAPAVLLKALGLPSEFVVGLGTISHGGSVKEKNIKSGDDLEVATRKGLLDSIFYSLTSNLIKVSATPSPLTDANNQLYQELSRLEKFRQYLPNKALDTLVKTYTREFINISAGVVVDSTSYESDLDFFQQYGLALREAKYSNGFEKVGEAYIKDGAKTAENFLINLFIGKGIYKILGK